MEKMIAFCGTVCAECPAFLATKMDDDNERKKLLSCGLNDTTQT